MGYSFYYGVLLWRDKIDSDRSLSWEVDLLNSMNGWDVQFDPQ